MTNEIVYTFDTYKCDYKNKINIDEIDISSVKRAIVNRLQIQYTDYIWFFYDEHTTTEEVKYGRFAYFFITADNKFYHTEVLLDDTYENILGAKTYVSKSIKNVSLIFKKTQNGRYGLAGKIGDDYEILYGGRSDPVQPGVLKYKVIIPPNSMFIEGMHVDFVPPGIYEAE